MTYDWDKLLGEPNFNKRYFENIDNIFGDGHSLINNPDWPKGKILEKFIPYKKMKDKKVLEIGCGSGLVTSHLIKSGALVNAIDITENAISITKKVDIVRVHDVKEMGRVVKMSDAIVRGWSGV